MPAPSLRAPLCWVATFVFFQTSLLAALCAMFPAILLLFFPCASARILFVRWAGVVQSSGLSMGLLVFRCCLGTEIVLHGMDVAQLRQLSDEYGNMLVIANHRTTLDWGFIWAPMAAMGRLRGQRFVTMHWMRFALGIGWGAQCFGYAFLRGKGDKQGDLERVRRLILGDSPGVPLTPCLFPEGHDLTSKNIKASNRFADQEVPPLPHYTQVLHPRTAGFRQMWDTLHESVDTRPPIVVDMTIGYEDYERGKMLKPAEVFLLGRAPTKVHILIEVIEQTASETPEAVCRRSFALKEKRLNHFYSSIGEPSFGEGAQGVTSPLGAGCCLRDSSLVGSAIYLCMEAIVVFVWHEVGNLWMLIYLGISILVFIVISCCGGIDGFLMWHSRHWPCPASSSTGSRRAAARTLSTPLSPRAHHMRLLDKLAY